MNLNTLKVFISRLEFISKKLRTPYCHNYEINFFPNQQETHKIAGTVNIQNRKGKTEVVFFETKLSKSEDMLVFKTIYQSNGKLSEEIDTFAIATIEQKGYFNPQNNLLIHLVNNKISEAYYVGRKYQFENGISDSFTKLNMNDQDMVNLINNTYGNSINRKR